MPASDLATPNLRKPSKPDEPCAAPEYCGAPAHASVKLLSHPGKKAGRQDEPLLLLVVPERHRLRPRDCTGHESFLYLRGSSRRQLAAIVAKRPTWRQGTCRLHR